GLLQVGNTVQLGGELTVDTRIYIGGTEVMFLDQSTGYIGVGNTNPQYKLDVSGDIRISTGSDLYFGSTGLITSIIGDRVYTGSSYITSGESITASLQALDDAVEAIA